MVNSPSLLILGLLACLLLIACGKSDEEIASEVAQEWTESSFRALEDTFSILMGGVPVLSQVASSMIMDQIEEKVVWQLEPAECRGDNNCSVVAHASADLDVNLPMVVNDTVSVGLPFILQIDTSDKEVDTWTPDFDRATVSGIQMEGLGDVTEGFMEGAGEFDIDRATEDLEQIAEDLEEPMRDVSEGLQNLFGN